MGRGALGHYPRCGGFPEVVLPAEALHRLILGEYASLMLHCDVRAMKRVQQVG